MPVKSTSDTSRRSFLKRSGVGTAIVASGLAGCVGDGGGDDGEGGGGDGDGDGGGTTTQTVDEVKIGSIHPLSGYIAETGTRLNNAVKLAAKIKNEAGGIDSLGGATVNVVEFDHKAEQETAAQGGKELVDEGVVGLLGTYFSPGAIALTQIAEQEQVPFMTTVVGTNTLLRDKGLNYSYRPQPNTTAAARDYAEMVPQLIRDSGNQYDTVGIFHVDNPFGQEIKAALNDLLPEQDVEVVEEVAIEFGANNADTQATKLRDADPDAIVMANYEPGGRLLLNSLQNLDYRPPFLNGVFAATFVADEVVRELPDIANGTTNNTSISDPTKERTAQVKQQYQETYDTVMDSNAVFGFIGADVLIQAIEEAGSDDPTEINDALSTISVDNHIGAMPAIEFLDNGENANSLAPVTQIQDKSVKIVHPERFADADPQF
jgi:branched-chain amino acid transport system substrate-binding protein